MSAFNVTVHILRHIRSEYIRDNIAILILFIPHFLSYRSTKYALTLRDEAGLYLGDIMNSTPSLIR